MAIDILNIQPSVISRDLKGKFVCIYSLPKVGKTSMACQFPKNLLLGFEHGWNAIGGVKAIDVTKWADFKLILRQLEKPEAKTMYDTITIDTIGIAWDACEQYICAQNGVQKIADIPWGGGIEKRADDSEVEILGPAIPKRAYEIVNQLVDIIGYIDVTWDEEGNSERWLYTRKTPTVMAGSRFKYLAPKIKFGYQELVDAIAEAIEKSEKIDGAKVVDKQENIIEETLSFNEVRNEAMELWNKLIELDPENSKIILKKVEMVFGRVMKLSEITEDQVDLFNLVVLDMRDLLKEQTN